MRLFDCHNHIQDERLFPRQETAELRCIESIMDMLNVLKPDQ
jgi:hypothetical protein